MKAPLKYEIQKRSKSDPAIWYVVAWADTREWAEKIAKSLNICENEDFRVYKN